MVDRILTTHVGSLPRPERVGTQLVAQDRGLNFDPATCDAVMQAEVDTVNNCIEHPRLVAQRRLTRANIVGRDRVMAATDCGLGTFAGSDAIHRPICYAKLASMAQGARMASDELWNSTP